MILRIALASLTALWALSAQAQVITNPDIARPIGCAYNTTPVTLTDGQAGWIQCDSSGKLSITTTISATGANNADNVAAVTTGLLGTASFNYVWDGATWDRLYGDSTNGAFVNIKAFPAAGTGPVGTKAAGTAAAVSLLPGAVYNSTVLTLTDGQQAAAQADSAGSHQINTEGKKATYSAVAQITPAAGATNIFTITGSASKTVRVTRLQISGIATAASAADVVVQLHSTAASGGTSTTKTAALHDSTNAAATAVVRAYTANPTTGTFNAYIRLQKITLSTAAGAIPIVPVSWDFTTRNSQGVVLRGTSQYLAIDWNAQTITGNSVNIDAEWTEE